MTSLLSDSQLKFLIQFSMLLTALERNTQSAFIAVITSVVHRNSIFQLCDTRLGS